MARNNNGDIGDNGVASSFCFSPSPTLEDLRSSLRLFAEQRDWDQFHTPRNLLLAMVGEVGELSEIFQWRGEVEPGLPDWSAEDRTRLEHELSDVLLYLVRLSHVCGVDLPVAAQRKLALNGEKYPAGAVRGDSRKYSEYGDSSQRQPCERETPDGQEGV